MRATVSTVGMLLPVVLTIRELNRYSDGQPDCRVDSADNHRRFAKSAFAYQDSEEYAKQRRRQNCQDKNRRRFRPETKESHSPQNSAHAGRSQPEVGYDEIFFCIRFFVYDVFHVNFICCWLVCLFSCIVGFSIDFESVWVWFIWKGIFAATIVAIFSSRLRHQFAELPTALSPRPTSRRFFCQEQVQGRAHRKGSFLWLD